MELISKKRIRSLKNIGTEFKEALSWKVEYLIETISENEFKILIEKADVDIEKEKIFNILKAYSIWMDYFPGKEMIFNYHEESGKIGIVGEIKNK